MSEETTATIEAPAAPKFADAKGEAKKLVFFDPKDLTIVTDESHHLYDERVKMKLDPALVENVRDRGIIEPIVYVREGDKNLVVAGRQRVRAATEANKGRKADDRIQVPGVLWDLNEKGAYATLVAENEFRIDDSPLVRARKMDRAMRLLGASEDEVAKMFGVSKMTVKNILGLLTLVAPARKAVDDGKIAANDAYQLARIKEPEDQKKALEDLLSATEGKSGHAKSKAKRKALDEAAGKVSRPSAKALKSFFDDANKSEDETFREAVVPVLKWALGMRKKPPTIPGMPEPEEDGEE